MMEDSLFQNIYPLQFVSKIVALSPFSTESKKLSAFWTIYSLLLAVFMICLSVYQLNLEISDKSNSKLFKFVAFVYIASPTISRTLTCFIFMTKYKIFLHFLECASEIESVIKKILNVPLSNNLYIKFQNLVIFMVIIIEGVQVFLVLKTQGLIPAIIRSFTVISYLCQAQFVCCVLLLNQYLAITFDRLSQLGKTNYVDSKTVVTHSDRIPWQEDAAGNEHYEEKTINTCREIIRYISIIKDDLNSFFSFPILFIIADSLVLITFNLYMLIKNTSFAMDSEEMMQQISYLYTVSLNVIQVFFIAFPSAAPGEEVQRIAGLTHKLINIKEYHEASNMVLLSKQLLHIEMVFTACGFFTLNESLITSVFAAISTQLVILLQFQMSSSDLSETVEETSSNHT